MLATAMFAAVATDACAQTPPPPTGEDDSVVLNNQLQLGDVIAGQTLNVVNAQEQVTVTTDCGMKQLPRYCAVNKLRSLVAGTAIVRRELTG